MAVELITGRAGTPHVDSSDMRALYAQIVGRVRYLLNDYGHGVAEMESNNVCHLLPAELLVDGAHVRVTGDGERVTIDNGVGSTYKRIDIVALHYTSTGAESSAVESVAFEVVKGESVTSTESPEEPAMPSGSATILDGATDVYIPYVKILINGINPGDPELKLSRINYNLSTAGIQLDLLTGDIDTMKPKLSSTTAKADASKKAVSKARTVCGSKVVSVNNSGTFVLFQANELSSLASSVGGRAAISAIAATNGDWNSMQVKIVATLIQNNAALCFLEKAITGSLRVNYAVTFTT